ncbi:MAG TPA: 3D domain-containing protein [Caulobacteraceae bacterium]|jgi:3D (Asp-Asp-Asp) domain-containing protein|nr:3D domain-containing protein [Caulobacteraceae bacterium]
MKRFLACLATLALTAVAVTGSPAGAQTPPHLSDPIGDLIIGLDPVKAGGALYWKLRASLYHGGHGMRAHDSLGCAVSPMRTVAADRALVSRHSIIFIRETVGLPLPGGKVHDGFWYVSDVGSGIRGQHIDLFTGHNAASMRPLSGLNMKTLSVSKVGEFPGCPPIDGGTAKLTPASN